MSDLQALALQWQHHKTLEVEHQAKRRHLEDQMAEALRLEPSLDETRKFSAGDVTVKVIGRLDRKVDADKVQEIAAEHGIEAHLSTLFRWKPEVNMRAWNAAPEAVTKALSQAITVKPGRPSFQILTGSDKE